MKKALIKVGLSSVMLKTVQTLLDMQSYKLDGKGQICWWLSHWQPPAHDTAAAIHQPTLHDGQTHTLLLIAPGLLGTAPRT